MGRHQGWDRQASDDDVPGPWVFLVGADGPLFHDLVSPTQACRLGLCDVRDG